jgi:RNA polymerase sigma-70 factor (ECF subfamily)
MTGSPVEAQQINRWVADGLRGDEAAYSHLYDTFSAGLYRLCYSLLLNREDAEDIVQDSFVYAFRNLFRYRPELASFKTWLYTIAICRCRNLYRSSRRFTVDLGVVLNTGVLAPLHETPEAAMARSEARSAIERALADLNPRLREAVVLRYGQGMAFREIAEVMGCPQKTAESRVRLAHETLRGALGPNGHHLLDELLVWNQE